MAAALVFAVATSSQSGAVDAGRGSDVAPAGGVDTTADAIAGNGAGAGDAAAPDLHYGWALAKTAVALAVVVGLMILVVKIGAGRLSGAAWRGAGSGRLLEVVERLPVGQRQSVVLVRAAKSYLVVGLSEAGLQLVTTLDGASVQMVEDRRGVPDSSAGGRFAQLLSPKGASKPDGEA